MNVGTIFYKQPRKGGKIPILPIYFVNELKLPFRPLHQNLIFLNTDGQTGNKTTTVFIPIKTYFHQN